MDTIHAMKKDNMIPPEGIWTFSDGSKWAFCDGDWTPLGVGVAPSEEPLSHRLLDFLFRDHGCTYGCSIDG